MQRHLGTRTSITLHTYFREKGVGSATSLGNNIYDSNKTEVLRLLLVLLSRQIYIPGSSLFTHPSLFSLHIVQKMPRRDVLTIMCSLLNTAMNSSTTDTITIGTIAGKLPYNHLVFKGEDPRTTLISTCLQVLCVLLDFQSGSARDLALDANSVSPNAKTNTFRYFIMKLVSKAGLLLVLGGYLCLYTASVARLRISLRRYDGYYGATDRDSEKFASWSKEITSLHDGDQ